MEEETKNEIVKKVLEELKSKKLLKNPKSSYKSTEKILYSLNVLPEAIKLIDEEVEIADSKWYKIIPMYYFDEMTIEEIAEELDCSVGTISMNKKDLINKLKVYIFPDTFMNEL